MLSYHNDQAVKDKYTKRFAEHRAADEVIQGTGFSEGRGCFVGCTLDEYKHSRFPEELGWPEWLAYLADTIFEGIPENEAPKFGTDLLESVPIGVNLEPVRNRFLLAIQRRNLKRIKNATSKGAGACIEAVKTVIKLLEKNEPAGSAAWLAAWSAARSAVRSAVWSAARSAAESAARSASESAEWSAEELEAESAAESATWSAEDFAVEFAAWSASESASESAAGCAAWSASELSAESAAEIAARSAEFQTQRNDLLEIIRECGKI